MRLSILFLSSILAHQMGGGNFVAANLLIAEVMLISLALFMFRNVELIGPYLALAVLITQSSSHFILGAGDKTSDLTMTLSHLSSGIIAYKLVSHLESIWNFLVALLGSFFDFSFFKTVKLPSKESIEAPIARVRLFHLIFTLTHQLRAPPGLGVGI